MNFCGMFGLVMTVGLAVIHSSVAAEKVSIQHSGVDRVGKFLAHEVSEEISRSPILQLGEQDDDGWNLVLMTMASDNATSYSVVLVRKRFDEVFDQFVVAFNGNCPLANLGLCAQEIVEHVRDPISQFESNWREPAEPATSADNQEEQTGCD